MAFYACQRAVPRYFSIIRLSDGREVDASELAAIRVGDCIFSGIGPVKLHAVVPRFLEAIAKWDPTSLFFEKNGKTHLTYSNCKVYSVKNKATDK